MEHCHSKLYERVLTVRYYKKRGVATVMKKALILLSIGFVLLCIGAVVERILPIAEKHPDAEIGYSSLEADLFQTGEYF